MAAPATGESDLATLGGTSARSRRRSPRMNECAKPRCRRGDSRGHRHPQGLRDRLRPWRRATDVRLGQAHRIDSHRRDRRRSRGGPRPGGAVAGRHLRHTGDDPSPPLAKLGHTDYLFNLAVSSELLHEGTLPGDRAEVLRVLRPSGGVLALGGLPQGRLAKLIAGSPLEATTATVPSGDLPWPGASRSMARVNGRIHTAPPRRPPTAATRSSTAAGWPCSGSANRRAA